MHEALIARHPNRARSTVMVRAKTRARTTARVSFTVSLQVTITELVVVSVIGMVTVTVEFKLWLRFQFEWVRRHLFRGIRTPTTPPPGWEEHLHSTAAKLGWDVEKAGCESDAGDGDGDGDGSSSGSGPFEELRDLCLTRSVGDVRDVDLGVGDV